MIDGRIDTQGTVDDLRSLGLLDELVHDESKQFQENEVEAIETTGEDAESTEKPERSTKQARKLVEDEQRATGGVKWSIHKAYLRIS